MVGTVLVLYLNFFILNVQLFRRTPALIVTAPTQTEPPFVLTQLLVLALLAWLVLRRVSAVPSPGSGNGQAGECPGRSLGIRKDGSIRVPVRLTT